MGVQVITIQRGMHYGFLGRPRTIKEATVKRFHYETHDEPRVHLADFVAAYNFALVA